MLLGGAIAVANLRAPVMLVVGVASALAGVLLALRGARPVVAPRAMLLALAVIVAAAVANVALALWADWQVGAALSEGASLAMMQSSLRTLDHARAACRSLALFSSLAMLIGALVTRADPPSGK